MMGSPYYYDVHFDPVDVVVHDCMWSGTCCIQLVQQQPDHVPHQITFMSHDDGVGEMQVREMQVRELMIASPTTTTTMATGNPQPSPASNLNINETKVVRTRVYSGGGGAASSSTTTPRQLNTGEKRVKVRLLGMRKVPSKLHHLKQQQHQPQTRVQQQQQHQSNSDQHHEQQANSSTPSSSCTSATATASNSNSNSHSHSHSHSHSTSTSAPSVSPFNQHCSNSSGRSATAADNKKLRHREVEKNRHRQLQAMVKTLSDRIPGKTEKETQVQTMKRAAKYCLYLRDVLTHGQQMGKDKLERLYLRSCENVDLMMAHDEQACASPSVTPLSPHTKCED